jgi:uncharacterized membrane protein YkvA (DUF1232 family)
MSDQKERNVNNDTALAPTEKHSGFFGELWQQVRLVYKLLLDPEVPIYLKVLPFAAIVYLLLPFDFLPDVIPGFGQLDDLTILIVGAKMFIDMAPHQVVERHLRGMRANDDGIEAGSDLGPEALYDEDPDVIEGIIVDGGNDPE